MATPGSTPYSPETSAYPQGESNTTLKDTASNVTSKVADITSNMSAKVAEARTQLARRASDYAAYADRHVREQPWAAVGVSAGFAFASGILLGLLIGSTRK
jgi:ElaB/YqjD/DUF883 family membrane-anchored ribosome-binding protein